MKKIYYKRLRELMAKHLLDKQDISKIIGKSYRQTSKILHNEISGLTGKPFVFDIREAVKLVTHFRNLGEVITIDELFFDDVISIEDSVSNF